MNDRQKLFAGVLLVVGAVTFTRCSSSEGAPTPTPTVTVTATVTATPTPVAVEEEEPVDPAPTVTDQAAALARTAVDAWQSRDVADRQARLAPIASPEYVALIAGADPTNIPTAPVQQVGPVTVTDDTTYVNVTLTDGTVVTVVTTQQVVTDIRPA